MLRIPVQVTFNPGWGWVILARQDFKEPRGGEGGSWSQRTPSARGAEATHYCPWSPHPCATPGSMVPGSPGPHASSSDAGPGRRRRSLLLLPCTGSSRHSGGPDSGSALSQASPALPVAFPAHCDVAPGPPTPQCHCSSSVSALRKAEASVQPA